MTTTEHKRAEISPCAVCKRPTRPPRALLTDYPGTLPRTKGMCVSCYQKAHTPQPGRQSIEEIEAGLESFLRARREREARALRREFAATYPHLARRAS